MIGPPAMHGRVQVPLPGIPITWQLHIFNESGGLLQSVVPNSGMAAVDLSSMPAGNYEWIAMSAFGTTVSGTVLKR